MRDESRVMEIDGLKEFEEERSQALGSLRLAIAGTTHVGRVRQLNQDAFDRFEDPDRGEILLVVADGLGGHRGGEVASRMAVGALGQIVREARGDPEERLESAATRANELVFEASNRDPELKGMGTTVVALLIRDGGPCYVAHAGDSRLYCLRGERLEVLTEDHSVVALMVREGLIRPEEARDHPKRNQIIRALGVQREIELDIAPIELEPGDRYLLCSDGLHGMLPDDDLQRILARAPDVDTAVAWLVDAANQAGGTDNITALLMRVLESDGEGTARTGVERIVGGARALIGRIRQR
jgi:protein phosphatase